MAAAHHHLAAAIVPPLGFADLALPALVVCLVCLLGVLVLGTVATGRRRRMMIPAAYSLLALLVTLIALVLRGGLV